MEQEINPIHHSDPNGQIDPNGRNTPAGEPFEADGGVRELRRDYHDRVADVREHSLEILRASVGATEACTRALVSDGNGASAELGFDPEQMQQLAALVDSEVVDLLALESPVARDLRMILVARDVTQLGLLCVGLCVALGARIGRAAAALSPDLCQVVADVGGATADLLRRSEAAWATLDTDLASGVALEAVAVKAKQTEFITALLGLDSVSMDAALDLALVARAFERLADHAAEIGERVLFAVHGTPAPLPDR